MWKAYFYHTKSERIGLLLLISLIVLLTAISWSFTYFKQEEKLEHTAFSEEVEAFEADIALHEEKNAAEWQNRYPKYQKKQKTRETRAEKAVDIEYFEFDPNLVSEEELLQLGLTPRTAKSILNYREKGGEFRIKSDLAKIYNLNATDYERLEAYINLPDSIERRRATYLKDPAQKELKKSVIEVNQATAADFQRLRGIGPAFSKRIIKYRNALGGFIDIDQLGEVYGLPDSTFLRIRSQLRCDAKVKKINLNTATVEELKAHPYLRWKHANAIVRYREENGPYTDPEILRTFFEFDDGNGTYWKIQPYLML